MDRHGEGIDAAGGGGAISVFDERVRADDGWGLQEKRFSGFRRSLSPLAEGARMVLSFEGPAVSVVLASMWQAHEPPPEERYVLAEESPGPRPGATVRGAKLAASIDGGPARLIDLAEAPLEVPLAEGLPAGRHELAIVAPAACRQCCVLGFRVPRGPFGAIEGLVRGDYDDRYLNDVRVDIRRDGRLIGSRLARNPFTRRMLLWGLEPGVYDLEISAVGWLPAAAGGVAVRAGRTTAIAPVHLAADPLAMPQRRIVSPRRGYPVFVEPGGRLEVAVRAAAGGPTPALALLTPLNRYPLEVIESAFDAAAGLRRMVCKTGGAPERLYHLEVIAGGDREVAASAVCIRSPRPAGRRCRIVKFGHMDTWTQRPAEYLRILSELTDLIDPDVLLVGNETNWHYVAGALRDSAVPYLTTTGNHGMGGCIAYFGPRTGGVRMGGVFIGNHGRMWQEDHSALEALFAAGAAGAEHRVLQGVEADIPADLAHRLGLDLYAFGHGFTRERPEGCDWLHLGKEFHLVELSPPGVGAAQTRAWACTECLDGSPAKYPIPRDRPWSPVTFTPANDGRHRQVAAVARNPLTCPLPAARVRFLMPRGRYKADTGTIRRQLDSDDGEFTEVQIAVDIPARGEAQVVLSGA